jgi:hypothetical protein
MNKDQQIDATALEETARTIHAGYTKYFAKLSYDGFRHCWLRAAALVLAFRVNPERFIEAQRTRRSHLDPEELVGAEAMTAYHQTERQRTDELIGLFRYSERYFVNLTTGGLWGAAAALGNPMLAFQATFRVVKMKLACTPEEAARVIQAYGKWAALEIRSSRPFRQDVQRAFPELDMDAFLEELDGVPDTSSASPDRQEARRQ